MTRPARDRMLLAAALVAAAALMALPGGEAAAAGKKKKTPQPTAVPRPPDPFRATIPTAVRCPATLVAVRNMSGT